VPYLLDAVDGASTSCRLPHGGAFRRGWILGVI
jgi:hypothetical protein